MKKLTKYIFFSFLLVACKPDQPVDNNNTTIPENNSNTKVETKVRVVPPDFNGD